MELIDLYPTIATWVGAPIPERILGSDLNDLIAGGDRGGATEALISNLRSSELTAWVIGKEKLVRIEHQGEVRWMLFDLATDPGEQDDLAESKPERLAELKGQLLDRRNAAGAYQVGDVETAEIDEEMQQDLNDLGYVEDEEEE